MQDLKEFEKNFDQWISEQLELEYERASDAAPYFLARELHCPDERTVRNYAEKHGI